MTGKIPSVLMCVGRQYYRLHQIIDEAEEQGISKRIPLTAIPEGLEKGLSKIFIAHPDAIVKVTAPGKTLADLAYKLLEYGALTQVQWMKLVDLEEPYWTGEDLAPGDFVPSSMLDITYAVSTLDSKQRKELVEEFGLEFCMGVIGYSFVTGLQYVCRPEEDGLPEELSHMEGYIEPVHVKYEEDLPLAE